MSAEAAPQFVDTNILIYAYDRSAGSKHERARELIAELWLSKRGCLSVQVLQEFYVVATRKLVPIAPADLRMILSDLALWRVHAPGAADVLAAADLHQRYQVSYWDAMILLSAARLGCGVVWSEDLNPGQAYQRVRVMNPFDDLASAFP
jgi:predicted nucleic acid-binding protein